jgi:hypothetical protein
MPPSVFICWMTGCCVNDPGSQPPAEGAFAAFRRLLHPPCHPDQGCSSSTPCLSSARGPRSNQTPIFMKSLSASRLAHREFAPDLALAVRITLPYPRPASAVSCRLGDKSSGFFRPSMRVTSSAALAPYLLPTSSNRVLLFCGVGAPAEHRKIGHGVQAAADIGDPREPRPGQRNRRQLQRLNDLAAFRQVDQASSSSPARTPSQDDVPRVPALRR